MLNYSLFRVLPNLLYLSLSKLRMSINDGTFTHKTQSSISTQLPNITHTVLPKSNWQFFEIHLCTLLSTYQVKALPSVNQI